MLGIIGAGSRFRISKVDRVIFGFEHPTYDDGINITLPGCARESFLEILMSTVTQRFNQFLSNIQLTKAQLEDAITKHNGVRQTLHEAYYSSAYKSLTERQLELAIYKSRVIEAYIKSDVQLDEGYKYRTSLLVGSYGKNTAIAPPSDIDILFELPASEFSRYDSYT